MDVLENETLLPKSYLGVKFPIDDKKIISVSPDGTTFTVYNGISVLYTCKLKPRLTTNYKIKFVFENPFGDDVIFNCTDNVFLEALSWIFDKETDHGDIKNEIS